MAGLRIARTIGRMQPRPGGFVNFVAAPVRPLDKSDPRYWYQVGSAFVPPSAPAGVYLATYPATY